LLVAGLGGAEQAPNIWSISVVSGGFRKLRDNAWLASPAPDGASIAFISPDYREIWLMRPNGEEPRRLLAIESGATFLQIAWAPDGKRLAYLKNHSRTQDRTIESCDLKAGQTRLIWSDRRLKTFCWTPRGRIIATLSEPNPDPSAGPYHSDLGAVEVSPSGSPGPPRPLTNFAGFTPLSLSVTADGRRLALIRNDDQSDVYVGELDGGGSRLSAPRRITLDDRIDWPGGWARDSKAVLFYSDRQGSLDLFRQPVDSRSSELLLSGPEEKRQAQFSPDGAWIVYLSWPRLPGPSPPSNGKVMRMPAAGGPPQPVFEVKGYPGSAQIPRELGVRALTAGGQPDFRCPRSPLRPCILCESDAGKLIFSTFDPVAGKRGEAARVDVEGLASWDVSPDGSKIVLSELGRNDRIRILHLTPAGSREVPVKGFRLISAVGWSADGSDFFVTGMASEGGSVIRHIGVDGRNRLLYKVDAWLETPLASPDGRYLSFGQATSSSNVWLLENF
jgi:eukaryotic-like serine/threonine-protein kinase